MKEASLKKAIYFINSIIWHSEKGKTMKTVKRSLVAAGSQPQELPGWNLKLAPIEKGWEMADRSKLAGGRFNKQRNFTKRKKPIIFFQKVNINETRPSLSKFLNYNLLHRIPMLERTLKGHLVPFQAFRKEKTKRTGNKEKGN